MWFLLFWRVRPEGGRGSFSRAGETLRAVCGLSLSTPLSNEPSFEQIVREHQAMVFRTLARMTGRRDGMEDLAQDVFLRLFRALPGFRNEALVSTYLYRITVNVAQDEWKRRRKMDRTHVSISDEARRGKTGWNIRGADSGAKLEERRVSEQLVEEHLMELSGVERAVLVLYHQEERSYRADRRGAGDADRHGADASASRTQEDAGSDSGTGGGAMKMEREWRDEEFESRLIRALESGPVVPVSEDFALRVASRVPAGARMRLDGVSATSSVGKQVAWLAAAVLLMAIFVLAPTAVGGPHTRQWIEVGLGLEFMALATWLSFRIRLQP